MAEDVEKSRTRVQRHVEDALELCNYVIATGLKGPDGQPVGFADIGTIQAAAAAVGIIGVGSSGQGATGTLTQEQWAAFEQAYYHVAIMTNPVTAETLRATRATSTTDALSDSERASSKSGLWCLYYFFFGYSPAQRFTRLLWLVAIAFAVFVVVAEWQINKLGLEEDAVSVKTRKDLWESLLPWSYGGLGACAYLLRSAHYFIYQRSFDMRRTPEYLNRILLGSISGGAIILFSNYLISEDDNITHFGSAALGFIAGYSTDFLFNTIERIVTAIFPKVSLESVPKESAQTPQRRTRQPAKPLDQPNPTQPYPKAGPGVQPHDK